MGLVDIKIDDVEVLGREEYLAKLRSSERYNEIMQAGKEYYPDENAAEQASYESYLYFAKRTQETINGVRNGNIEDLRVMAQYFNRGWPDLAVQLVPQDREKALACYEIILANTEPHPLDILATISLCKELNKPAHMVAKYENIYKELRLEAELSGYGTEYLDSMADEFGLGE